MKTYYKHNSHSQGLNPFRLLRIPFSLLFTLTSYLIPHKIMRRLSSTQRLFINMVIVTIILIFGVFIYTSFINPEQTKAAWFNTSWQYRQQLSLSNTSGSSLTDFQIPIATDTASMITQGKLRSDCSDIRITDQKGKILPHWIEKLAASACNTSTTKIWVKVPEIPTSGASIFLYYGNSSAQNIENGKNTFVYFDDFNNNTLDTNLWVKADSYGEISVTNNKLAFNGSTTGAWDQALYLKPSIERDNYTMEYDYQWTSNNTSYDAFMAGWKDNGTGASYSNLVYAYYNESATTCTTCAAKVYEDGTLRSTVTPDWTKDTNYKVRLRMRATGGAYYDQSSDGGITFTTAYTSTYSTESNLHPGWTLYSGDHYIDNFFVRKDAATPPTVSFASEEQSPGPVAYWKFDEGSGTTAGDSSGNNYTGTLVNGPAWKSGSECLSGGCLYFDGTDDYINVGASSRYGGSATSGSYTVEAWVKPTDVGRYNVVTRYIGGGDYFSAGSTTNNGWIRNMVRDTVNNVNYWPDTGKAVLSSNTWAHITFVLTTGVGYKYYVNGTLINSVANTNIHFYSAGATAYIGIGTDANSYFKGYMDEIKVYPYERSASQVKTDFNSRGSVKGASTSIGNGQSSALTNGLVGYWKMDESSWNGTSGEVIDSSGNGNNGTAVLGAEATSSAKFGNAGYFAGVDESVSLGTPTSMTSRTYSIWIKPNAGASVNGRDGVLGENAGTRIDYGNGVGSTSFHSLVLLTSGSPSYKELTGTGNGTTGWSHLVLVIDNQIGKASFYVNGTLSSTATWNTATQSVNTSGAQYLGYVNSAAKFNGYLDEARIYNRALSPSEVQQLYNYAPGPVGYWNFEEGSGNNVNDSSGNNNSGTWSGTAPYWTQGQYGKGGKFNGSDSYVNAGTSTILQPNQVTLELYLKTTTTAGGRVAAHVGGTKYPYDIYINPSGTARWEFDGVNAAASNQSGTKLVNDGKWHHIAIVYDGTKGYLYVDGILNASNAYAAGNLEYNGSSFLIGRGGDGYPTNGSIDEVRIYNYARTPGQIVSDMNGGHPLGGSPVGSQALYARFDEGYGTVAHDSGPNSLNGTLSTSSLWTNDGKFSKAIKTNGSSTYASLPDNDAIDYAYNQDFSVSFWMRDGRGNTNGDAIVEKWTGSGGYPYVFRYQANSIQMLRYDGTNNPAVAGTKTINDGAWHYVVGIKNGSTLNLYIDNIKQTTGTTDTTTGTTTNSSAIYIGARGGSSFFWNGYIDELKVYSAALSSNEIKIDYTHNAGLSLGSSSTSDDGKSASNSASRAYCVPGDTSTCSPPVAEYLFEEFRGTTANDSTGNGNTATLQSTPVWTQGKNGSGLHFDTAGDYMSTSGITVGSDWTVSVWTKFPLSGAGGYRTLARQGANVHHILVNPSNLLGVFNSAFISSGFDVTTLSSGWHFLTAVGTGGSTTFYIDGRSVGSSASQVTSTITQIGGVPGSQNWGAPMDEFRVYNYVRTGAQIAWDYNQGRPIAQWRMDECQGSTLHDAARNGNDGTITIGASGTQTSVGTCNTASTAWGNGASGKFNSSLNFDGTDDYVSRADTDTLDPRTGSMTWSMWFKNSQASRNIFYRKSDASNANGILIDIGANNPGRLRCILNLSPQITAESPSGITHNDGNWHMLACILNRQDNTLKLYVDGKMLISSDASALSATDLNASALIYVGQGGGAFTNGQIDDVQIFNYALTQTQIRNIMNQSGAVRFGPATGTP